jgi:hypothetical protein
MLRRVAAWAAIAGVSVAVRSAVGVDAAELGSLNYAICGSAPEVTAIAHTVLPQHSVDAYRALASETVHVQRSASTLHVSAGAGPEETITTVNAPGEVCSVRADGAELLSSASAIPGANIAAADAVLTYRAGHPWPLAAAPVDQPSTSIQLQTRRHYLFVMLSGSFKNQPPGFGCGQVEYYRVDPSTFEVRSFDGCVEGHQHATGLPGIRQLPN